MHVCAYTCVSSWRACVCTHTSDRSIPSLSMQALALFPVSPSSRGKVALMEAQVGNIERANYIIGNIIMRCVCLCLWRDVCEWVCMCCAWLRLLCRSVCLCLYLCVYVCVCVCMCVYVTVNVCVCVCACVSVFLCVYLKLPEDMCLYQGACKLATRKESTTL